MAPVTEIHESFLLSSAALNGGWAYEEGGNGMAYRENGITGITFSMGEL
jgi:hypothetical protein